LWTKNYSIRPVFGQTPEEFERLILSRWARPIFLKRRGQQPPVQLDAYLEIERFVRACGETVSSG
jgi:hypothetical protein